MDNTVILVTREGMGHAERELSLRLMKTYLTLVLESNSLPGAICFYTDGVTLAVEGSPVLDELHALEKRGIHLILCPTCLNYFGLADKVQVGIIGGMGDILLAQTRAAKVISV